MKRSIMPFLMATTPGRWTSGPPAAADTSRPDDHERRWHAGLLGGSLSGIAFVALILLAPEPGGPGEHAGDSAVAAWYGVHGQELVAAMLISGLAYLLFLVFQASLVSRAGDAGAGGSIPARLVMAGSVLLAAFQVLGAALVAAPALVSGGGFEAGTIAGLALMGSAAQEGLVVTATFWRCLVLGAIAVLAIRGTILARWFGWLTAALAAVSLVAPLAWTASEKTELVSLLGFGSHLAFYAWTFLASVIAAVRAGPAGIAPAVRVNTNEA